jgi:Tol biopolymer transport system component/DNA-binding winged helix-turn-helix (wHTH) protein
MNPRETASSGETHADAVLPAAYEFAGFRLLPRQRRVMDGNGQIVPITAKAYEALVYLIQHAGQLVPRVALIQALWPSTVVEDNNLNQAIAALRRALGDQHIVTVAGRGYQFVTPVIVVQQARAEPEPTAPPRGEVEVPAALGFNGWGARRFTAFAAIALLVIVGCGLAAGFYLRTGAPPAASPSGALGVVSRISTLTAYPGSETTPSFAPDGIRVAFAAGASPDTKDIFVTQIGSATPLQLTRGGTSRDPAWSPDGAQIAFFRQHDPTHLDLMVVAALGGAERMLRAVRSHLISRDGSPRLAWTPDAKELLFTTQRDGGELLFDLSVYSLETGVSRPLGIEHDPTDYDTSPALSPDGARLAFVRFRPAERMGHLFVQDLSPGLVPRGKPVELPEQGVELVHSPSWSADGKLLRFAMGSRILEWDGSRLRTVHTLPSRVQSMAVHDGRAPRIVAALANGDTDIYALPLNPATHAATGAAQVRVKSTSYENHPRFSPDGKQLAFISSRSGRPAVWLADAQGQSARQLTFMEATLIGFPRWSPDGARIAFHGSNGGERTVYVADATTGKTTALGPGCCPSWWSADGTHLYVGALGSTVSVARMDVTSGKRETLFVGDLAVETTDRSRILYSKGREAGIFARSLQGNPARNPETQLVADYTPTLGATVPVASGFYYIGHTPEGRPRAFRFYDYASGAAKDVAPAPLGVALGLSVSPDETELLFAADAAGAGSDLSLLEFNAPVAPASASE